MKVLFAAALLFVALFPAGPADAAVPGFDSQYAGESSFQSASGAPEPHTNTVFFFNAGTVPWIKHTASEVVLAVCLDDKVTCNVESPLYAWSAGLWPSRRVYATQLQQVVQPGQLATFTWFFHSPPDVVSGQYVFHGDLMHAATGAMVHPEGYFHIITCSCP